MRRRNLLLSFLLVLVLTLGLTACKPEPDPEPLDCEDGFYELDGECVPNPIEFDITLNSETKTINQGDSFILVVTLDGITDYDSIGWAADGDLLTIAPDGLNAVITAGTTTGEETITVTVTKDDVDVTADCVVTIEPVTLSLSVESETITLDQGESVDVTVAIDPDRDETVVAWSEDGSLLTIDADGNDATITAGAATGTTTVVITATIFGEPFTKEIEVTVNEITPYVDIESAMADVNLGDTLELTLDFLPAYQSDKTWAVAFDTDGFATAEVNAEDVLVITGVAEGTVTLTLTMTTDGTAYTDTVEVTVRPLGYVGIANNVYDPFDLQLNFTESTLFSTVDEEVWREYDILLGATSNTGEGDLRGQFVFAMNSAFAKDGDMDVIQLMANGMSTMAIKIPDTIDDLAAIDIVMDVATLDPSHDRTWRWDMFVATEIDGVTTMYGRATDENNALQLGSLYIEPEELLRDGYHTYRFFINEMPANAGDYIVIYFGNTNLYNGTEEDRTFISGFNFINKELTGIELTTAQSDVEYVVGQDFDPTDLVVSALTTAGSAIPIDHDDLTFTYDFSTVGTQTVTIGYLEYTVTTDVTVIAREITALELTSLPDLVIYADGDMFDTTGMVLTAIYNDETTEVVTGYTYDMTALATGALAVTLTFDSLTIDVPITVYAAALSSIAVTTPATKLYFAVGEDALYDGIEVTATLADSSTVVVPFADLAFSGFDSSAIVADQVITVSYGGQSTTYTIDIIERQMTGLVIDRYPLATYMVGANADWSSLEVSGIFNDETTEPIAFEDLTISGFDSSAVGELTITVTYETFTTTFSVTITDEMGYNGIMVSDLVFDTTGMVPNATDFTAFFFIDALANLDDYDILLGRVMNDEQRNLWYRDGIYMEGEGAEQVIILQTNGMSALAVRVPDGLTAADITAFSMSISGEGIAVDETATFRPSIRFSSIFDSVEYFHGMDRGDYFLPSSGGITIAATDLMRDGYWDYTIPVTQPTVGDGVTVGNFMIVYMGNNGTFRDATSLKIDGFKFWTRDTVSELVLASGPDKVDYIVGEEFDPTGLELKPIFGLDLYEMPDAVALGDLTFDYDFSTGGTKTVTISYGGASVTVDVTVVDKQATGLELTTPPTTDMYYEGDVFDPTDMVVSLLYNDGSSEVITGYTYPMDPLVLDATAITLTYDTFTLDVPITVSPLVLNGIAITTPPTDTEFVEGQTEDFSGIVVTASYDNGTTAEVPFADLVFSGFDSSAVVAGQTITVTFGDQTATFTVDIIARVMTGIALDTYPQVTYTVGDSANWDNLVVSEVYNDDSHEAILLGDLTISGFDSSAAGTVTVTVDYLTYSLTFDVLISEASADYVALFTADAAFDVSQLVNKDTMYTDLFSGATPADRSDFDLLIGRTLNDGERMLQYSDILYLEGEGLDKVLVLQTNGMSAFAVRIPDGMTAADITAFTISVSGEGLVFEDDAAFGPRIRFSSIFDGVEYFHTTDRGLYWLPESGRISIPRTDLERAGFHEYTIPVEQPTFDAGESVGNYMIVYLGNNGDFRGETSLLVNGFKFWTADLVSDIAVTTQPTLTDYVVGDTFDPTGMVVTPTYAVDIYGAPDLDNNDLTFDYDFSAAGTATVTVNYGALSTTLDVTVIDRVLNGITVTTPPTKTEFVEGQTEDFAGIVVNATFDNADPIDVPFEDLVFSGFDSSAVTTGQTITVTYGDQTATFTIDIIARVETGIEVDVYPQLNYIIGDSADWTNLEVVKLFNDDSTEAVLFGDLTISGFDSSVAGTVTITVDYMTFSTTFDVMIHESSADFVNVFTSDAAFDTTNLVNKSTMYTDLFSGATPADIADFDVLLGRTLNDGERMLQYSDAIYFEGEGLDRVIVLQTNGMSAFAVRIPDGLTAADITAFSFSLSGEGIVVDPATTFRPTFRFSSIYGGVEYFHTTDRGLYYLPESGRLTIEHADYTQVGFHDYTVAIEQPTFDAGESAGNYILIYLGNNGAFRDSTDTSLLVNGFKFWTADTMSAISVTTQPTKTEYVVGETFDPTDMVVSPTYDVPVYGAPDLDNGDLTFDYDFSTAGATTVTITYGAFTTTVDVTVVDPA